MHIFQPFTTSHLELNPYTIQGESGVCITVEVNGEINTQASMSVAFGKLWTKEVVFVFVRESSYTKELLDKSDFFSVTFFEDKYKTSVSYLRSVSGRVENKIEEIGMHINRKIDIPYIDEGNLVFLCDKLASIPLNDNTRADAFISQRIKNKVYSDKEYHYLVIGEILEVMAR